MRIFELTMAALVKEGCIINWRWQKHNIHSQYGRRKIDLIRCEECGQTC